MLSMKPSNTFPFIDIGETIKNQYSRGQCNCRLAHVFSRLASIYFLTILIFRKSPKICVRWFCRIIFMMNSSQAKEGRHHHIWSTMSMDSCNLGYTYDFTVSQMHDVSFDTCASRCTCFILWCCLQVETTLQNSVAVDSYPKVLTHLSTNRFFYWLDWHLSPRKL